VQTVGFLWQKKCQCNADWIVRKQSGPHTWDGQGNPLTPQKPELSETKTVFGSPSLDTSTRFC